MSVLRAIESKIEGLFEGVFGRAFRTNVQPIELARWLAREMDQHRSVSVSRVYRPDAPEPSAPPEPEPEPPRPVVTLSLEGREIPVTTDRVLLGRSRECDIRLTDTNVSRRHAEVRREDDTYWIVDLGSTNGT